MTGGHEETEQDQRKNCFVYEVKPLLVTLACQPTIKLANHFFILFCGGWCQVCLEGYVGNGILCFIVSIVISSVCVLFFLI